MIKAIPFAYTGINHSMGICKSEDTLISQKGDKQLLFGVADGQGEKSYSALGGELSLRGGFSLLQAQSMEQMESPIQQKALAKALLQTIQERIEKTALEMDAERNDFSSTLLLLSIDPQGDFYAINLGSGFVLGIDQKNTIHVISHGEKSNYNSTWLTSSPNALAHLRFSFGSAGEYKRIIMASDGVSCLYRNHAVAYSARSVLRAKEPEAIIDYLDKKTFQDDASGFIVELFPKWQAIREVQEKPCDTGFSSVSHKC